MSSAIDRVAHYLLERLSSPDYDEKYIAWFQDREVSVSLTVADLESLLADARRLQAIQDKNLSIDCDLTTRWTRTDGTSYTRVFYVTDYRHRFYPKNTIREAIDAAMEQSK